MSNTAIQSEAAGGTGQDPFNEDFDKFSNELLEYWHVPGVSIAVIDNDSIYAKGYGFATLPDVPATADTLWYTASTTKAFTAALLSKLIHSKKYPELAEGWATPISSIIRDDFVLQDAWATNHVTLNDAVSHQSGMAGHDLATLKEIDGRKATLKDIVRSLRHLSMRTEPRTKWQYSNLMYITLGHVIETVTGQCFADLIREQIWEPLDMKASYLNLQHALDAPQHLADGYIWDSKVDKFNKVPLMEVDEIAAAGGILSNVKDYAKWLHALLHEAGPFSQEEHDDIRTPRMISVASPKGEGSLYGLGWRRSILHGKTFYQHAGGMHAYASEVFWLPEMKYALVLFGNTSMTAAGAERAIVHRLIEDKLNIPIKDRIDTTTKINTTLDGIKNKFSNPLDTLYPNRPEKPVPSSFKTSQLVGSYHNKGYGTLTLREEEDPERPGEIILVADRPDIVWQYQLRMHHATGDYWATFFWLFNGASYYESSLVGGQFKAGVDGKPATLELDMGKTEKVVVYDRVE